MQTLKLLKHHQLKFNFVLIFIVFWVPTIIFAKLAGEILEREPINLDITILHWIHSHANSFLDTFFLMVTTVGNVEVILPVVGLVVAYMFYKKKKHDIFLLLAIFGGAGMANFILKNLFQRDRPAFWHSAITETSYSFPSGHAMLSSALALSLIIILWDTKWRNLSLVIGLPMVFAIGFSRLYMGVHYPTDIIAGWSVSIVWALIVTLLIKKIQFNSSRKPKIPS